MYLPATTAGLLSLTVSGEVGPAPLTAYAVTPALREAYLDNDPEELEYAAMIEAARASLRLLAAAADAVPPRRVVLSADVAEAAVSRWPDDGSVAAVTVRTPVPIAAVASVHVDDEEAERDVRAAVAALPAADAGDDDAQFTVDGAEGHELLWYATQEIPDLLR